MSRIRCHIDMKGISLISMEIDGYRLVRLYTGYFWSRPVPA